MADESLNIAIKLEASEFKKGMDDIRKKSRDAAAELKEIDKQLKSESADKVAKLAEKISLLQKSSELAAKEAETYAAKIKQLNENVKTNEETTSKQKVAIEVIKSLMEKTGDAAGIYKEQLTKLNKQLAEGEAETTKNKKAIEDYSSKMSLAKQKADTFALAVKDTEKELKDADNAADDAGDSIEDFGDSTGEANKNVGKMGDFIKKAGDESTHSGGKIGTLGSIIKGNLISKAIISGIQKIGDLIGAIASKAAEAAKAIVNFGKEAIQSAASLNETMGTTDAVFGNMSGGMKDWASSAAENFGLAKNEALKYSNMLGQTMQSFGVSQEQSVDLVQNLVGRAADIGAALDFDTSEVIERFQAAMRGEYASIDTVGIVMNATSVRARALKDKLAETGDTVVGFTKATAAYEAAQKAANDAISKYGADSEEAASANDAMLEAQKELDSIMSQTGRTISDSELKLAAYNIIMDQSKKFTGTFADEATGWNGLMKILTASFSNVKDEIGLRLLPVAEEMMGKFKDFYNSPAGTKLMDSILKGIEDVANTVLEFVQSEDFSKFMDGIGEKISALADSISEKGPEISEFLKTTLPEALDAVVGACEFLVGAAEKVRGFWQTMKDGPASSDYRQAWLDASDEVKAFSESMDTDLGTTKQAVYDFAEANGISAADVYNNWSTYQPQIAELIEQQKSCISDLAESSGLDLQTAEDVIASYCETNKLKVSEVYGDWNTYEPQISQYMNTLAGNTGTMAGDTQTSMTNFSDAVKNGLREAGNADRGPLESLHSWLSGLWSDVTKWASDIKSNVSGALSDSSNGNPKYRASGGTVYAGQRYIVGENGWEYFIPNVNGTIVNHSQSQIIENSANNYKTENSRVVNQTFNIYAQGDSFSDQMEDAARQLQRQMKLTGASL